MPYSRSISKFMRMICAKKSTTCWSIRWRGSVFQPPCTLHFVTHYQSHRGRRWPPWWRKKEFWGPPAAGDHKQRVGVDGAGYSLYDARLTPYFDELESQRFDCISPRSATVEYKPGSVIALLLRFIRIQSNSFGSNKRESRAHVGLWRTAERILCVRIFTRDVNPWVFKIT